MSRWSLALCGNGYEVDVIGKLLAIEGLLVVIHDVGEVRIGRNFRQSAVVLALL